VLQAEKTKDLTHEPRPVISCPKCGVQYRGGSCRSCGYEPTAKERKAVGLEFVAGELVEISKQAKPKKQSVEDIWRQALYQAGRSNRTYKQAIGLARSKAAKQGTKFSVPARLDVAGKTITAIPLGDPDGNRRVKDLYERLFA
jgi:hypothetical protein